MKAEGKRITPLNPSTVAPPAGRYTHGMLVPADAKLLFISGQVGMAPDGTVPSDFAEQARNAWRNLIATLAAGGMTPDHLVKVTHYLIRPSDLPAYRAIRAEMTDARPASTLIFVTGLVDPGLLIEIDAVAAQP